MSAPRAPKDADEIREVIEFLRQDGGQDDPVLARMADFLEDLADGKWTLTNAMCRREPSVHCGTPAYCGVHGCQL